MKKVAAILFLCAILGTVAGAAAMRQSEPQIVRVGPTRVLEDKKQDVTLDTLKVTRYGVDVQLLENGIFVACYITNPKVFGKGHPSLSCVGVPLPSQLNR